MGISFRFSHPTIRHPRLASIWLHSTSSLCGSTPTPTLPRKRERGRHDFAFSRRIAPKLSINRFALKQEGAGNAGCRLAPAVSCANSASRCAHEHTGTAGAARHSLRDGFTAYTVLSPETNSSCLRRRRIEGLSKPGWVRKISAGLTPATGARTTRLCRPLHAVRRARGLRS